MRHNKVLFLMLASVLIMIMVSGCSGGSGPKIVQDELLMFVGSENDVNIGELYIKDTDKDKEKIASDINDGSFMILNDTKTILYTDKENNFYIKEKDKEKEKLTSDVIPYSIISSKDESTILFIRADKGDMTNTELYIKRTGKEKEKIASEIMYGRYGISSDGTILYYIDIDDNLYIKKDGTEKEKISSDVSYFTINEDGQTIAFVNNDSDLYIKRPQNTDKEKVSSEVAGIAQLSKDGKVVAYLNDYNYEKSRGELYIQQEGQDSQKISSDIAEFQLSQDGKLIYFINEEKDLYVSELSKLEKEKLGSEITNFMITEKGDSIVFIDEDSNLYLKEAKKEREKLATDVSIYSFIDNTIVYLNEDKDFYYKELGKETQKLGTEVEDYQISRNATVVAYHNDKNELYMKINGNETQKVLDNLRDYSVVYLQNSPVFTKKVVASDIVGIWKDPYGNGNYVEFTSDGKAKIYYDGQMQDEYGFKLADETQTSATIDFDTEDISDVYLEIVDPTHITFDFDEAEKITKEQLDKELEERRKQIEHENKMNELESIADDILYTYQYVSVDEMKCYAEAYSSSELLGTLSYGSEVYIEDTYIDANYQVWAMASYYDYDLYEYIDFWFNYNDIK